jgi:hypothetical protein
MCMSMLVSFDLFLHLIYFFLLLEMKVEKYIECFELVTNGYNDVLSNLDNRIVKVTLNEEYTIELIHSFSKKTLAGRISGEFHVLIACQRTNKDKTVMFYLLFKSQSDMLKLYTKLRKAKVDLHWNECILDPRDYNSMYCPRIFFDIDISRQHCLEQGNEATFDKLIVDGRKAATNNFIDIMNNCVKTTLFENPKLMKVDSCNYKFIVTEACGADKLSWHVVLREEQFEKPILMFAPEQRKFLADIIDLIEDQVGIKGIVDCSLYTRYKSMRMTLSTKIGSKRKLRKGNSKSMEETLIMYDNNIDRRHVHHIRDPIEPEKVIVEHLPINMDEFQDTLLWKCLDLLPAKYYTKYFYWFRVGLIIFSMYGKTAIGMWKAFSMKNKSTYDASEIDSIWNNLTKAKISIGSVIHWLKQENIKVPYDEKVPDLDELVAECDTVKVNSRYLDSDIADGFVDSDKKYLLLRSGCGTGKTQMLSKSINKKGMLYIGNRIMLNKQVAKRLGIKCYTDIDYAEFNDVIRESGLTISPQSLHKIEDVIDQIQCVIIDEADQTLREFAQSTCKQKLVKCGIFKQIVKCAPKVVFMSATLNELVPMTLQDYDSDFAKKTLFVDNEYKALQNAKFTITKYSNLNLVAKKIIEARNRGLRVIVPCGGIKTQCFQLERIIMENLPQCRIKVYTRDQRGEIKRIDDIDAEWSNYDVVIHNNTIESGVSSQLDFGICIGVFSRKCTGYESAFQMCFRARQVTEFDVHFIDSCIVRQRTLNDCMEFHVLSKMLKDGDAKADDYYYKYLINQIKFGEPNSELKLLGRATWRNEFNIVNLVNCFVKILELAGAKIVYEKEQKVELEELNVTEDIMQEVKEEVAKISFQNCDALEYVANRDIDLEKFAEKHAKPAKVAENIMRQSFLESPDMIEKLDHDVAAQYILVNNMLDDFGRKYNENGCYIDMISKQYFFDKAKEVIRKYNKQINIVFPITHKSRRIDLKKLDTMNIKGNFSKIKGYISRCIKKCGYDFKIVKRKDIVLESVSGY